MKMASAKRWPPWLAVLRYVTASKVVSDTQQGAASTAQHVFCHVLYAAGAAVPAEGDADVPEFEYDPDADKDHEWGFDLKKLQSSLSENINRWGAAGLVVSSGSFRTACDCYQQLRQPGRLPPQLLSH